MDLILRCDCTESQWFIFNELDIRGLIEMDEDWNRERITVATSSAMLPKVARILGAVPITFSVANKAKSDTGECAVECSLCGNDLKNAQVIFCGCVFCSECIRAHTKNNNTCPICNKNIYRV